MFLTDCSHCASTLVQAYLGNAQVSACHAEMQIASFVRPGLRDRCKLPELFILWNSAHPRGVAPLRLNQRLGRASYSLSLSLFPKSLSRVHPYRARASRRACASRPAPGGLLRGGGPSGFRSVYRRPSVCAVAFGIRVRSVESRASLTKGTGDVGITVPRACHCGVIVVFPRCVKVLQDYRCRFANIFIHTDRIQVGIAGKKLISWQARFEIFQN